LEIDVWSLVFGAWCLELGILEFPWSLVFGAWNLAFPCSLVFGAWKFGVSPELDAWSLGFRPALYNFGPGL